MNSFQCHVCKYKTNSFEHWNEHTELTTHKLRIELAATRAERDEAVKTITEIVQYVRYAQMETENDNAVLLAIFKDLNVFLEKITKVQS